ncbi:MAG: hypothetical protein SGI77_22485 [Pirellulaceae bacterium]|nr:hypothetical protein [Pirellulaceae bacterium]
MAEKKKPTHEIRLGAIRATIWANETYLGDRWFNVTTSRSYKDDQGQWQETYSYAKNHLSDLRKAIDAADLWIEQNVDRSQRSPIVFVDDQVEGVAEQSPQKKKRRGASC